MPIAPDIRKRWIEARLVDELDRPIVVRDWMLEEVIKPLDGYHAWRRGDRACDECADLHGTVLMSRAECEREPHDVCDGLAGHKILTVLVNLKTQQGKTTTGAAYSLSELALAKNSGIFYVGSAEDQAKGTFDQKWRTPINKNAKLKKRMVVRGRSIRNVKKGNTFRFIATSLKSAPGGTWRLVIADEAALIPDEVLAKLVSRVTAAYGLECPNGHFTGGATKGARRDCPTCRAPLEEFFGRLLLLSSSEDPVGAFFEMIEEQKENPDPSVHVFQSPDTLNPNTSEEALEGLSRSWGRLPSMRGLIERQFGVEFTRKGEEFIPKEALTAILNKNLAKVESSVLPCVGFLDCSRTTDLMSLVLGMDPREIPRAFSKIRCDRIDVFDPKNPKQFPRGRVRYLPDPDHPGTSVREHLVSLFGGWVELDNRSAPAGANKFPGLLELWIDVTRWEEARDLYDWARKQPWGGRVRKYEGNKLDKTLMWELLEERALAGARAIEAPYIERLKTELRSAAVKLGDNGISKVVMDTAEGDRRKQMHRDIAMSLAGVCWAAAKFFARDEGAKEKVQEANRRGRTKGARRREREGIWAEKT